MNTRLLLLPILLLASTHGRTSAAQEEFAEDLIPTSGGDLTIGFVGHGTLMFRFGGKVIHVDPIGREADYSQLPDADVVLVTHDHGDHLDPAAIQEVRKGDTEIIVSRACDGRVEGARVVGNGETATASGIRIEAIAAYNVEHMRAEGQPYHPKGAGNGYLITFSDLRVYVAGDTEATPEMRSLRDVDVAFLPMNLPYTMTPEMVADAARAFRPRILYPYHFGETDPNRLAELLRNEEGIEVRIRDLS